MAEKIERIRIRLACSAGNSMDVDPTPFQFGDHCILSLEVRPRLR